MKWPNGRALLALSFRGVIEGVGIDSGCIDEKDYEDESYDKEITL